MFGRNKKKIINEAKIFIENLREDTDIFNNVDSIEFDYNLPVSLVFLDDRVVVNPQKIIIMFKLFHVSIKEIIKTVFSSYIILNCLYTKEGKDNKNGTYRKFDMINKRNGNKINCDGLKLFSTTGNREDNLNINMAASFVNTFLNEEDWYKYSIDIKIAEYKTVYLNIRDSSDGYNYKSYCLKIDNEYPDSLYKRILKETYLNIKGRELINEFKEIKFLDEKDVLFITIVQK